MFLRNEKKMIRILLKQNFISPHEESGASGATVFLRLFRLFHPFPFLLAHGREETVYPDFYSFFVPPFRACAPVSRRARSQLPPRFLLTWTGSLPRPAGRICLPRPPGALLSSPSLRQAG